MPRILVAGHVTHDRYGDAIVPGGCAYYAACVHRELGADVHLVTSVGRDFRCEEALRAQPTTVTRAGETTLFTNLYPEGTPRLQLLEASAPEVVPDGVPPELLHCDVVHLAPVLGEIAIERWKRAVRPRLLAIGVQGWIKVAGPSPDESAVPPGVASRARVVVQRPWDIGLHTLRGIDVACLSDEDAREQGNLVQRLREAVPLVVLTHGTDGSEVMDRGTTTRIGIFPTHAVDPTGAGDTFAAALVCRLACGDRPVAAARFAAAAASIVVEGTGGATLGRLAESERRAAEVPVLG